MAAWLACGANLGAGDEGDYRMAGYCREGR
jgi:hypothetical protein